MPGGSTRSCVTNGRWPASAGVLRRRAPPRTALPYAVLGKLDADERERLITGLHEILTDALEVERRRRGGGLPTKLGDHFTVHGRWGQPCPRCGADLRRVSYESHEVTYCPTCQTGGKVLADRRLSRLIR